LTVDISQFIPKLSLIYPELIITLLALMILGADLIVSKKRKIIIAQISIFGLIVALISCLPLVGVNESTFSGMFICDSFALFFKILFIVIGLLTILLSISYITLEQIHLGEYYTLLLLAILGMMIMAAGNDLMIIYLGIELMALSVYALVGFLKHDLKSNEAALKYFVLGAFTSGVLLYGISLLYGETGTTNLEEIQKSLISGKTSRAVVLAMVLLIAGFAFKIAAVPFHLWCPDAYDGAPTSITAFMSVGPKAAGFAALLRVFVVAMLPLREEWSILLWIISASTMILGNVMAITQTNIKRLLAYSSIAHAGYGLMGLVAAGNLINRSGIGIELTEVGKMGVYMVMFYLLVYTFMNLGAFGMVILMRKNSERGDQISDFNGLAKSNPFYAASMAIFLFSLMGIPPLAGFVGKFYIFTVAIEARLYILAIIGVLTSVISAYYYFLIIKAMYIDPVKEGFQIVQSKSLIFALMVSLILTLLIGIYPAPFLSFARESIFKLM